MKIIDFGKQKTVINKYIEELRNVKVQNDRARFRRNLERIGEMMAFEISKTLNYSTKEVETPLGTAQVCTHDDAIVLATIFRAGLPFHQGFLNVFDHADNAFVSAYRYYKDKECHDVGIHIEYIASPSMEGKTLIIADPMLATGSSMELAYEALLTKGHPKKIHLVSVIASRQAIDFVRSKFPDDTTLWVAAVDDEINSHKYIVPGLGDAGDLAFGEKEG